MGGRAQGTRQSLLRPRLGKGLTGCCSNRVRLPGVARDTSEWGHGDGEVMGDQQDGREGRSKQGVQAKGTTSDNARTSRHAWVGGRAWGALSGESWRLN